MDREQLVRLGKCDVTEANRVRLPGWTRSTGRRRAFTLDADAVRKPNAAERLKCWKTRSCGSRATFCLTISRSGFWTASGRLELGSRSGCRGEYEAFDIFAAEGNGISGFVAATGKELYLRFITSKGRTVPAGTATRDRA